MSEAAIIARSLFLAVVLGFLRAVAAPGCVGGSFVYPSVFSASFIGYVSGRIDSKKTEELDGLFTVVVHAATHGWVAVIFGVAAAAVGWFLGVLFCFNVMPQIGFMRCVVCQMLEKGIWWKPPPATSRN